ncbi:hypothetical protein AB0M95_00520 [Sphaerisporangium sp. NPDC051017]|uniref:hypothetical protein n=1 Tax=Sphaerisporangium sp. NPDC051017 TaxID=3154636 RepID=UPI00343E5190
MPLGCRWCGHPPYAHDAASLPHRRHHEWEQPTAAQMRARLDARRRLGLCDSLPSAAPVRPRMVPPSADPYSGRHARPVPVAASHGQDPPPAVRRESYRPQTYRPRPYAREPYQQREPYARGPNQQEAYRRDGYGRGVAA